MVTLCITVRNEHAGLDERPLRQWEEWFPSLAAAQEREAALLTPPTDAEARRLWSEQTVSCRTRVEGHDGGRYAALGAGMPATPPEIPMARPGFRGWE